jgi:predicted transcriptional regulator
MGVTRSDIFTRDINRTAELAKAFAHPARITIIKHLIEVNGCIVNDLVEVIGLSQSTISQHLKELKSIGIVKGEIEGPRMCYCINQEVWKEAREVFEVIFDSYRLSNCC